MGKRRMSKAEKEAFVRRMARARGVKGSRRRNKSAVANLKVAGVPVKPILKSGAGFAVGAYLGTLVANTLGDLIISRIGSAPVQGVGYALGGVGMLILGDWLQKKSPKMPVVEAAGALSVPLFIRAFESFNLFPPGQTVAAAVTGGKGTAGYFGRTRRARMGGGFYHGPMPGMGGTIQPMPSAMAGFGGLLS